MQWMLSHQEARRNLSPEEKASCVHVDTGSKERDFSTNTRQQVAKMSGVGAGTVARYDAKTYSAI